MEACDGEEEKSQESCKEKEEVDSVVAETRPTAKSAVERSRAGNKPGKLRRTGSAGDGVALSAPSVAVAPGAGPAPNPAAAWLFS